MNLDPLYVSRIQFAFTISYRILFPSITIRLSVWLVALQDLFLATGHQKYKKLFDFCLKIFALLFVMGVVSGIVMAFQFGTNWSLMSAKAGSVLGPLFGFETITAFMLEATFLWVVLYARHRVAPWFYLLARCMVAFGTILSSFWILCNNIRMQVLVGYEVTSGRVVPVGWKAFVLFLTILLAYAGSFRPHLVPFAITIEAAAAVQTLRFLFYRAGIAVFPLVLYYTGVVYWVLRGKV